MAVSTMASEGPRFRIASQGGNTLVWDTERGESVSVHLYRADAANEADRLNGEAS